MYAAEVKPSAADAQPQFAQEAKPSVPVSTTTQPHHEQHQSTPVTSTTAPVPWSFGLYDCFSDIPSCCMTGWCPCVTFGRTAEILDKGSTSCCASGCLYVLVGPYSRLTYLSSYRTKLRQQYMLEETPCADLHVHFHCGFCALCQEYRELKSRGFDMSIGWQANVQRNPELEMAATAPVVFEGMSR